jgi:hypothetical protein
LTPLGFARFEDSNRLCCGKTSPELDRRLRGPKWLPIP